MPAALLALALSLPAPAWTVTPTDTTANFRAIAAGSGRVCWAAGSKGTFARTIDGKTWKTARVKGAETADFRSIAAFGRDSAVMLAIGDGAQSRIYRTDDGGKSWRKTFQNPEPAAFYDALAFWDGNHGLAFGDPVDGRFPLLRTDDGGRSWTRLTPDIPAALPGEAAFAASGRCLAVVGSSDAWIVTGGGAARVFHSTDRGRTWTADPTPVVPLAASAGLFGILPLGGRAALAVGGDHETDDAPGHALLTTDGRIWPVLPGFRPAGLREAAIRYRGGYLLVGPQGTDLSTDGGRTWTTLKSPGPLHTVANAGDIVWGVGEGGLIARLQG